MNTKNNAHPRDQRSHASRLTVDLPKETMTALKIHAAKAELTIKELISLLVSDRLKEAKALEEKHPDGFWTLGGYWYFSEEGERA